MENSPKISIMNPSKASWINWEGNTLFYAQNHFYGLLEQLTGFVVEFIKAGPIDCKILRVHYGIIFRHILCICDTGKKRQQDGKHE